MTTDTDLDLQMLWTHEGSLEDLDEVAQRVVEELRCSDPFCLWLSGEIGAGKTTLTGKILVALGAQSEMVVASPTFSYFTEYEVGKKLYGHLDFYRVEGEIRPEMLGLEPLHYNGFFVEWPEKVALDQELRPTHVLKVSILETGRRRYEIFVMN